MRAWVRYAAFAGVGPLLGATAVGVAVYDVAPVELRSSLLGSAFGLSLVALVCVGALYVQATAGVSSARRRDPAAVEEEGVRRVVVAFLRVHPLSTVEEIEDGTRRERGTLRVPLALMQLGGCVVSSWSTPEGRLLREAFTAREKTVKP